MEIGFLSKHLAIKEKATAKLANNSLVWRSYSSEDDLQKALQSGEILAAFLPLKTVPTIRTETTVAAAVLRVAAAYHLVIETKGFAENALLKLIQNPVISVENELEAAQICDYRNDFQVVYGENETIDAYLKLEYDLQNTEISAKAAVIRLDPTEFIPAPAEGVFVLLCAKNKLETAQNLRQFNDAKLVAISNNERRVLQLIGDTGAKDRLGVYCECDKNSNYHLWACWCEKSDSAPTYIKISQSTRFGLAEAAVKKLGF